MILLILRCSQIMQGTGDTFDQVSCSATPSTAGVGHLRHADPAGRTGARPLLLRHRAGLFKSVINLAILLTVNNLSKRLTGKGLF